MRIVWPTRGLTVASIYLLWGTNVSVLATEYFQADRGSGIGEVTEHDICLADEGCSIQGFGKGG